ncbi:MAG: hypothetical protein IPK73_11735 [Candidatus Obscuribacter sp.]|nr:hypothetical protein [Candidatus Obscuribacter sp.]MBK9281690.1 hypothetical protein [Candidatus Obscuribacter sp.]
MVIPFGKRFEDSSDVKSFRYAVRSFHWLTCLFIVVVSVTPAYAKKPHSSYEQVSSYKSLVKLIKSRPRTIFPYFACLELQVLSFKDSTKGKFGVRKSIMEAEVVNVLLDKTNELTGRFGFLYQDQTNEHIFQPGQRVALQFTTDRRIPDSYSSDLAKQVGRACILGFNPGNECDGVRDVYCIETLLPGQSYSSSDVAELTSKLQSSSDYLVKLKAALETYIESRWSTERIQRFCQPDARTLPAMQSLVPSSNIILAGQLYQEAAKQLGLVRWYCNLSKDGVPLDYQTEVRREEQGLWVLEVSSPSKAQLTDKEIDEDILWRKLNSAYQVYYLERMKRGSKLTKDFWDISPSSITKYKQNKIGRITGLEARLDNGQVLTAEVSDDLTIGNILVDGEQNTYWTEINAEASNGIDKICRTPR